MKRYALHLLLLANAALLILLAWMWVAPDGSVRNVHWQEPTPHRTDFAAMLPALPGVTNADTGQFIAMLDRPLFAFTRRPPPPPPPPKAAEEVQVDNLSTARLSGVFVGDGAGGIIIEVAGKHRRARLNDNIEGWTLQSINGRNVTFIKGDQSRVLQLPRAAVTSYTGMAPAAPVGAPTSIGRGAVQPPARSAPPRATFGGRS
ncbi:hypothetical protein [Acidovorax sp. NCPPB 3576]|uniref:hypothetical protein n=1 Tax=Acidovorax sp. NCPPB 3576 TaxID=2940488 RepID=UPI002349EB30|nr:hypothetical protein [Acidovorax sp. NCPPB 3576]WCM89171.1 hypothetical protein M5C98_03735 [Acidovorax sp. NCPPB 3576]